MLLKYSIKSFRWTAISNASNYKQRKARKQKKTENRKQVCMHTGNTKVGKIVYISKYDRGILQKYYERDRSYSRDRL